MKWLQKFDLFLLDFDGLLVNTEQLHFEAYKKLCLSQGFHLPWSFAHYCLVAHRSHTALKEALYLEFPELNPNWNTLYQYKKVLYKELLKQGKLELMPGVESLLKALSASKSKRCVVTHSQKEDVDFIRRQLPILDLIPVWITRENYENPKPAPDGYLKAIELLADPGDRVIGFEDSLKGMIALQGAEVTAVLICDEAHPQLKEEKAAGLIHYPSFVKIPNSF